MAVTVTVGEPAAVGVPEISPEVSSMESPAGRPVALQVYGAVPPAAETVNGVIAVPTSAALSPGAVTCGGPSGSSEKRTVQMAVPGWVAEAMPTLAAVGSVTVSRPAPASYSPASMSAVVIWRAVPSAFLSVTWTPPAM